MEFKIVRADISELSLDKGAIVLPSNTFLRESGGKATAVFSKAGRNQLQEASKEARLKYAPVVAGCAIPVPAFALDAACVLHAVLPKWKNGELLEYECTSAAYFSCLSLADRLGCVSIALPVLHSTSSGFSRGLAFQIATESINAFRPVGALKNVFLVVRCTSMVDRAIQFGYIIEDHLNTVPVLQPEDGLIRPPVPSSVGACYPDPSARARRDDLFLPRFDAAVDWLAQPDKRSEIFAAGERIVRRLIKKNRQ